MSRRGIWHVLGIDRTTEVAEIRRAYARRLKALDAELDADTFSQLRNARDLALDYARHGDGDEDDDAGFYPQDVADGDFDFGGAPVPLVCGAEAAADLADEPQPAEGPPPTDDQHFYEILMGGPPDVPLAPEESASLHDHLEALLTDPRMTQVDFFVGAERWLSEIVAQASPRSDPVVPRVVAFFGWQDSHKEIGQPWGAAMVSRRLRALNFLERVAHPGHPYHNAWRELTTPATEASRKGLLVGRKKVTELLRAVRAEHPELERHFDWHRITLWDKPAVEGGSKIGWYIIFGVVVAFQLLRLVGTAVDEPNPGPNASPSYTADISPDAANGFVAKEADIDAVLHRFDPAYSSGKLKADNPQLYQFLSSNWQRRRRGSGDSRTDYVNGMSKLLFDRYIRLWRQADEPLLADIQRHLVDEADELRKLGWKACNDFLSGTAPPALLPAPFLEKERKLALAVLINVKEEPRSPLGTTFRIGPEIVDSAVERSGLKRAAFTKAMRGEGGPREVCLARTALMHTVLDLRGEERVRLLRVM